MTAPASQAARASASVHLLSAQLHLAPDPDVQDVVDALSDLRDTLQRPVLRVLDGGRNAAN